MTDDANPGDPPPAAHPVANKKKPVKKPWSELTPAEAAKLDDESTKRRNRRTVVAEKKAAAEYAIECSLRRALQHQADLDDKESIVSKAHVLLMLSMSRPTPANLSHAAMAVASTGSSAHRPPQHRSPSSSVTHKTPDVHALPPHGHGQTRFSTSPDCVVVDPTTPAGVIDLNITPGYSGSCHCEDGAQSKQPRSFASAHMAGACKLFDEMPRPT
jgi:hypothetical protein